MYSTFYFVFDEKEESSHASLVSAVEVVHPKRQIDTPPVTPRLGENM
jgi:hypothetical protein